MIGFVGIAKGRENRRQARAVTLANQPYRPVDDGLEWCLTEAVMKRDHRGLRHGSPDLLGVDVRKSVKVKSGVTTRADANLRRGIKSGLPLSLVLWLMIAHFLLIMDRIYSRWCRRIC